MLNSTITIAIAGKGGTGKTTLAALLAHLLSGRGTVLAIDADPSSNLNTALGLPLWDTVGQVREEMAQAVKGGRFEGMSKADYLELKIREALVESPRIDLLAMGRPEGPGCYCAANHMLRACIDRLTKSYDYVVIDNEAGLEHISRQTTRDVDILIIISDPTLRSVATAARVKKLIGELRSRVGRIGLVVNRVNGSLASEVVEAIQNSQLELLATIPFDPDLMGLEIKGDPITQLPPTSALWAAAADIAQKLGLLQR